MYQIIEKILNDYGIAVLKAARAKLVAGNKNASGRLSKSLKFVVKQLSNAMQIVFSGTNYLKDVEEGFGANKREPSIGAILSWLQYKGLPDKNNKSKAFLIARKIKNFGVEPYPFMKPSIIEQNNLMKSKLNKDLAEYITKEVRKSIQ